MDYYVLLASNAGDFPENTPAEYSVHLPRKLTFDGAWQVALTEISFVRSWQTLPNMLDGIIMIDCGSRIRGLRLRTGVYLSPEHLVYEINNAVSEKRRLPAGTVASLTEEHSDVQDWIDEALRRRGQTEEVASLDGLQFSYDGQKVHVQHPTGIKSLWFSPALRALLGLGDRQRFEKQTEEAQRYPDMTGGISMLYLYSDICRSRIVSNTTAPLLRAVAVPNNVKHGERAVVSFTHPEYVHVDGGEFDLIHIKIRNTLGDIVNFTSGEVVITLHFRPVPHQLIL